jgi:hypothetical protein
MEELEGTMDGPDYTKFTAEVLARRDDAVDYIDSVLAPERARATKYYKGEKFGNEKAGRSQVVSTDVRDTVLSILPSIMRIYFASNNVVEFAPRGPEDIENASQATDYVNYVIAQENPGFGIFHAVFKDALVRKTGIIKWFWDESKEVAYHEFEGLGENEIALLASDPEVEITKLEGEPFGQPQVVQGQMVLPPLVYEVEIKRTTKKGRVVIEAVPPEEFVIDRNARCIDEAIFVGHRSEKSKSDLISMGYSDEELVGVMFGDSLSRNEERLARNSAADYRENDVTTYWEVFTKYDLDDDGIAELRKACFAGDKFLHEEPASEVQFAIFCPDPEPHLWVGQSTADQTMDIQRVKSAIMRNMMDSLAASINPRTYVVEGQVNLDDAMNDEVGGIVRGRAPGMMQPLIMPFVGKEAFPMLQYWDEVKENRTGMSKASMGLDADALQSTTQAAVSATVTGAQQHIELIARIFAETGMKRLVKGVLRLITKYQDQPKMVRLRGKWVPIDPRSWDSGMDVIVNVALGSGTEEEKLQSLAWLVENQKQILGMGPNNLVNLTGLYNSYAQMLQLRGFKNVDLFFTNPETTPPPPEKPDPSMMLAQLQAQDIQATIAAKSAENNLKREQMLRNDDLERDRLDADIFLKKMDMELNYGAKVNTAQLNADLAKNRELFKAGTDMIHAAQADAMKAQSVQ